MSISNASTPQVSNLNDEFHKNEQLRFKVKMGVFLVLMDKEHVLCLRRANTGIEDGFYVLPMGGVQEGETPLEALVREGYEEVGVVIDPKDVTLAHLMYRKHTQPDGYIFFQQDYFFLVNIYKGEISNREPHKADEVSFFSMNSLPENLSPFIKAALEHMHNGALYSEFGV